MADLPARRRQRDLRRQADGTGTTKPLAALALALLLAPAAEAKPCRGRHWVGTWAASPSDASRASDISSQGDVSLNVKTDFADESARLILTPTRGGATTRVRLSNRFGTAPVTFDRATIARAAARADLVPGTIRQLTFKGRPSVTVAPGADVVSDRVAFRYRAFQRLAVSVFVAGDIGKPTEHYTARQTSYLTGPLGGDHTADDAGAAFTSPTTARPFVSGIDALAKRSAGAVVAFGDSITDGYQGGPTLIPEATEGIDADGRYPDDLARRLRRAKLPLSVLNAGISGNRVRFAGGEGGDPQSFGVFGPAALKRLDRDVLQLPGARTVILLEGINDLNQAPTGTAATLIPAYKTLIARMHRAGLKVLQGTLTPEGKSNPERGRINDWIRHHTTADGVVDFDRAVRDPADADRIAAAYDGGDGLHFNLAGYRRMARAVPLRALVSGRGPCA